MRARTHTHTYVYIHICSGGKYSTSTGASTESTCIDCPLHTNTPPGSEGSDVAANCICNTGHYGQPGIECINCPTGKYKDTTGSESCSLCAAGKYLPMEESTSSSACIKCPAAKYSSASRVTCALCPLDSTSSVSSDDVTDCLCNAGYTGLDDGACLECVAGQYKQILGSVECTLCGAEKYSEVVGAVSSATCSLCSQGTYSMTDRNQCQACPSDSTSSASSDDVTDCLCNAGYTGPDGACIECVAGQYKGAIGSAECTLCGTGKHSEGVGAMSSATCISCSAGTYSATDRSHCVACPLDSTSPSSSRDMSYCRCNAGYSGLNGDTCIRCSAGTHKASLGTAECTECTAGRYSTMEGALSADVCIKCASGKYSETVGAASSTSCMTCPQYSVSSEGSSEKTACKCETGYSGADGTRCTICAKGTHKAGTGSSACLQCAIGKFMENAGSSFCNNCAEGAVTLNAGSYYTFDCICVAGYSRFDGSPCQKCATAKYKNSLGSAECAWCSVDTYTDFLGAALCLNCPIRSSNFVSGGLNRSEDRTDCKCFPGYSSNGHTSFDCTPCAAGTWKSATGLQLCPQCQAGKYSTEIAAVSEATCTMCPRDSNSLAGADAITGCTCNMGFSKPSGTDCSKCSAGKYKPDQGDQNCTLCGQGKYSQSVGQIYETTCVLCPLGTLSIAFGAVDNSTCQPCPGGRFMPGMGATACLQCPDKSSSDPGSYSVLMCRCVPGYMGVNGIACNPCPAGTYKQEYGIGPCLDCPTNADSPPGTRDARICGCAPGFTGLNEANGFACVRCAQNTYKNSSGTETCITCPANTVALVGSSSVDDCFCDSGYFGQDARGCVKCTAGKFKTQVGTGRCSFAVSPGTALAVSTVKAELKLSGMTKDESITSIEDFKKNVAESIISSEESDGLEWGSQSITIISVCVRTDCTVFDIERRRRFRRQSRGDEISVNYEVSVPNGMAASLLAQTMGDPSTVAAFETRMSVSTGKPVSARYDAMPAVAEAPPPLQSAPLFHHTPGGIVVIASSVLLLAAMLFYECLRRSAPRAFTKNEIKSVPPMHFSISMQQDLRHTSLEIFKSGLAHDLAAATGLDPKQILVVGVKRGAFLAVAEALMAKTPEKIAHDDREKSSAQPAESAEEDHHCLKKTVQKLILGNRVRDKGSLIAVAEIHLLYSADNGKVHLLNSTPKPCSDDKIDTVVHDLITQSKRLESVLMTGKWTRWTTQINDSRSTLPLYEQVASEFELHQEGPKEKNGIAIADWEAMHMRLKRWTARGRVTAQNSRASHEDSNVPSFQELALVEKRPTTTSGRPSSAFLTSGFNFNHLTQEKRER